MGAIRLSLGTNEPFLSPGDKMSIPPFLALRKLEAASRAFENDESQLEENGANLANKTASAMQQSKPCALHSLLQNRNDRQNVFTSFPASD